MEQRQRAMELEHFKITEVMSVMRDGRQSVMMKNDYVKVQEILVILYTLFDNYFVDERKSFVNHLHYQQSQRLLYV